MRHTFICLLTITTLSAVEGWGPDPAPNVILPQRHVISVRPDTAVRLAGVDARITITDGVAVTTLELRLVNPGSQPQEAELLLPLPEGAVVRNIELDGLSSGPQARLLPRDEARRIYEAIVARMKDPALVEFAGERLLRSSVFPVPPGGEQRLRVTWEHLLPTIAGSIEYVLPRSVAVAADVPWTISATVRDKHGLAGLHSPTHRTAIAERQTGVSEVSLSAEESRAPGSFRLTYQPSMIVSASVVCCPDNAGGGWFLLTAGAPTARDPATRLHRDVTIVLDRSGSMRGGKLDQAREAALQLIAGLDPADRFNLVCYHHGVERFAPTSVLHDSANERAAAAWLAAVQPRGGTNISDALAAALDQTTSGGAVGQVLFLTDGVPTVGETAESRLRDFARTANTSKRRIFAIGVGADVDTHLIEKLADDSRGTASFATPGQNVETIVAEVADRLDGPVLTDLSLVLPAGVNGRILDVQPAALGDLFTGQTVMVLGRYVGSAPVELALVGRDVTGERRLVATLTPQEATWTNDHVPRLWATRTIATLIDEVRILGSTLAPEILRQDPRARELIDEIVRLSTEFGVLTEYTAFLADDGTVPGPVLPMAEQEMARRASQRSGDGALSQSVNAANRKAADRLNLGNTLLDESMREVAATSIQPSSATSYYQRGGNWIEGKDLARAAAPVDQEIAFASPAYFILADRLATEHRQVALALGGTVILAIDGQRVRVSGP